METLIIFRERDFFFPQRGPLTSILSLPVTFTRRLRGPAEAPGEALGEEKPPPGPQEAALRANKLCFPGYNSVMAIIRPVPTA